MVIRDLDILVELSQRASTTVCFSVPTVDEAVWAKTEPGTPPPRKRLRVMKALVEAGIEAGVGMAPVLPGLSDSPAQLEATVAAAAEAGACFVWANIVYLKPGTKEHFLAFIEREYPHLIPRYRDLFPGRTPRPRPGSRWSAPWPASRAATASRTGGPGEPSRPKRPSSSRCSGRTGI